jgi:hypothetical protein
MSYLTRLKALVGEKRPPSEPAKPSEGAFAGFAGSDGSRFFADADAIEERAGLAADRVPPVYLDAWARLNCQKPACASDAEWRLALDDSGRFLDAWGEMAAEAGWTSENLFSAASGLLWRLEGAPVEAIGADHVRLSDGRTIWRSQAMAGSTGNL